MNKNLLLGLGVCFCLVTPAFGNENAAAVNVTVEVTTPTIDNEALEMNKLANVDEVKTSTQSKEPNLSATDIVQADINAFLQKNALLLGSQSNGKHYASAISQVNVNYVHADYERYKIVAFEKAYLDAIKEYAKNLGAETTRRVIRSMYQNNSTGEAFPEKLSQGTDGVEALIDKTVALGNAVLDSELEKFGIDPEEYKSSKPDQKKILVEDALGDEITVAVNKSLAGIVSFQNFSAVDASGQAAVGVLIMYSPKLEAIAQSLRIYQKPKMQVTGQPVQKQFPMYEPAKLYDLLGVRVVIAENGPVIVSFAQWAYNSNNNFSENSAYKQADNKAMAQIADFLNVNFSAQDNTQYGEITQQAKVKSGKDGSITDEFTTSIIDIVNTDIQQRSSEYLKGVNTIQRWKHTTPNGHQVVGIVKILSFDTIESSKRPPVKQGVVLNENTPEKEAPKDGEAKSRQSEQLMDPDMF